MPNIKQVKICRIKFPEIKLQTRDAHKLRGYFGNLFREHSSILHNHNVDGGFRYKYPMVQYKVIDNAPVLIGIGEGAELLPELFLSIKEIDISDRKYSITTKNIEIKRDEIGYSDTLQEYQFNTLWMALNQKNYKEYCSLKNDKEKNSMLNNILIGNILSFFRSVDVMLKKDERLMTKLNVVEKATNFKENRMLAFTGSFIINANLPNYIGIGKSVSRGFGTVTKII